MTTNDKTKPKLKRAKRSSGNTTKLYFTPRTQEAIVEFQKAQTKKERDTLYVQEIMPAFEKLVENLINIHKFSGLFDTFDDLKNDCVNFLFETILKFDSTRGTNAFSYFNVVAKNWLIIRAKQKVTRVKRTVSLDDPDSLTMNEHEAIEDHATVPSQDAVIENANSLRNIIVLLNEIKDKSRSEHEHVAIDSIIKIFANINNIDLLNKSAVLLYIRELSGLTPKQLTATMQLVKKNYRRIKLEDKFQE